MIDAQSLKDGEESDWEGKSRSQELVRAISAHSLVKEA